MYEIQAKIFELKPKKPPSNKKLPEWYVNEVTNILQILGALTIKNGHSSELDRLKNQAWQLIRL